LNKPPEEIVMEDGKVVGVKSQGEIAKTKMVICDPSYMPDKVKKKYQVVRAICLLNHPVEKAGNSASFQLILPQNQIGRKTDIYVIGLGNQNQVAAKGMYVAMVSTTVETSNPEAELAPGLEILQPILKKFVKVQDVMEPVDDGKESQVFISRGYDATTHFETTCSDVKDIYKRIMGEDFDFSKVKGKLGEDE